jgi:hypothetical protein
MRVSRAVFAAALVLASAIPARAQDTGGLAGLLLRFFSPTNPVVLQGNAVPTLSHEAHFVSQPGAQAILRQLNSGIAAQLSTFPIGSSSGGFTYTFDESLGVYNRTTQSFGPTFTERPLTAGKGKFSFGISHQRASYDSFEGKDLEGGDLRLFLVHEDVNNDGTAFNPWFEGDLIRADISIDLTSQTTVLVANYGLSETFDVGVALPIQRVELDARINTSIQRLASSVDPFVVHIFDDGTSERTYPESGDASGIGDMLIRGKWNFLRKPQGSLAATVDLRLPTGDENDLLGSGATQTRLALVAGGSPGRFSPRASFGYTLSSGGSDFTGDLPDELYYAVGFDAVPHPRVTFTADFLGRTLRDSERLVDRDRVFEYRLRTDPTVRQATLSELAGESGNLSLMLGAAGVKINAVGRLLLVANVLFKIGNNGLQDKLTPTFGIDYTF